MSRPVTTSTFGFASGRNDGPPRSTLAPPSALAPEVTACTKTASSAAILRMSAWMRSFELRCRSKGTTIVPRGSATGPRVVAAVNGFVATFASSSSSSTRYSARGREVRSFGRRGLGVEARTDEVSIEAASGERCVLEIERERHRPRGDVVEGRVLELVHGLEDAADQAVLRLRDRYDRRLAGSERHAVLRDLSREPERLDAVMVEQVQELVQAHGVAGRGEHPGLHRRVPGLLERGRVKVLLVLEELAPEPERALEARERGAEMLADVLAVGAQPVRRVELDADGARRLVQDADPAVDVGEGRALADVIVVEALVVEIEPALAIEERLGGAHDGLHEAPALGRHERIRARGHARVEVVGRIRAHLVVVDRQVRA